MAEVIISTVNGTIVDTVYTGGTTQATIELNYRRDGLAVQLTPTGGAAYMQASNDGTNWETWPAGVISSTKICPLAPVHYIRAVHTTATSSRLVVWGS